MLTIFKQISQQHFLEKLQDKVNYVK